VTRTISGVLSEPSEDGLFQFSAWDGTHFNCAGAFDVDVLPAGCSCPGPCF
jgi:hypothetical protein